MGKASTLKLRYKLKEERDAKHTQNLLPKIAPQIQMLWLPKLALCFCVNFILCVAFMYILKKYFLPI
ncbi:hypothetical protein [uncultured Helicobacter sp.]|uniref:hypothetical protein n=1 Tax=uncultured Helicobacter sp. TaxID=175537 RepID=UPI00374E7BE7